jgi:SAM-dependent methyltransferase
MLDFRNPGTYSKEDIEQLNKLITEKRKINLGCGGDIRSDFVNMDIQLFPDIDAGMNAFDLRVIKDDSIDFIVVQHLLEYIPRKHMLSAINEWKRILRPEGHLEIRVVDLDFLMRSKYLNGVSKEMGLHSEMVISLIYGQQLNEYDIRYNGFDSELLEGILIGCGFSIANKVKEDIDIIVTGYKK